MPPRGRERSPTLQAKHPSDGNLFFLAGLKDLHSTITLSLGEQASPAGQAKDPLQTFRAHEALEIARVQVFSQRRPMSLQVGKQEKGGFTVLLEKGLHFSQIFITQPDQSFLCLAPPVLR